MATTTRSSSTRGRRSILARIVALLALVACGLAIYFLVTSFTEESRGGDSKNEEKGRSGQAKDQKAAVESYTVASGDTLSAIAQQTGISAARIERLNPDLDSETLNAGQVLALR